MTPSDPDPLWRELRGRAERAAPRYDRQYGECPKCQLGATLHVEFCGVDWMVCRPCGEGWDLGTHVFAPPILERDEREDDFDAAEIEDLRNQLAIAELLEVNLGVRDQQLVSNQNEDQMTTTAPAVAPERGDTSLRLNVRDLPMPDGVDARNILRGVSEPALSYIGGRMTQFAVRLPDDMKPRDLSWASHLAWKPLRSEACTPDGKTVEDVLRRAGVASGVGAIQQVLSVLIHAGDIRRTLLAQKAWIDTALAKLDALERESGPKIQRPEMGRTIPIATAKSFEVR